MRLPNHLDCSTEVLFAKAFYLPLVEPWILLCLKATKNTVSTKVDAVFLGSVDFRYPHGREKKVTKKECPERDLRVEALNWLGWLDLNQRNDGVKVRCLTPWRQPNIEYGAMSFHCSVSFVWGG